MSKKLNRKNNIRYFLFITGVILFFFAGCSTSSLEKINVDSIKEKTKDIKKEDIEELKEKIKKIKK